MIQHYYRMKGTGRDTIVVHHSGPGLNPDCLAPDLKPYLENPEQFYAAIDEFFDARQAAKPAYTVGNVLHK